MEFRMWRKSTQQPNNSGVWCSFENKTGFSQTFFNNPSDSISHVCIDYLQGRFWNVKRKDQAAFIKRRFKEEIVKFKESM
jgi:hypothetical protein